MGYKLVPVYLNIVHIGDSTIILTQRSNYQQLMIRELEMSFAEDLKDFSAYTKNNLSTL